METVIAKMLRHLPTFLLALLLSSWVLSAAAETNEAEPNDAGVEAALPQLQISHVGADAVYLNGGRSHGLSVGQTVSVVRDGEPIAELQVAFVSRKSASCQVVDSRREIVVGDQALPGAAVAEETVATGAAPLDFKPPPEGTGRSSKTGRSRVSKPARWGDLSGTISARWHHFDDAGEFPRSFDQTTLRLNLRSQSTGGAYETRLRVRGREDRRYSESDPTETRRGDRLYEFAVAYQPPEGRLNVEMGRMTASPKLGFDYLDGIVGELGLKPHFGVGGFYGQRSNIDELSLGADGEAYGAFLHFKRDRTKESPFYADILLGSIRESYDGEVSREFISVYGRLGSGNRWSFYQRADIDINTAWRRDVAGDDYQVSNLLTNFNYRFSDSLRLGFSFDRRRRFRELDNRDTPEEIFDDRLREGLRLTAQIGDSQGWRLTSSAGIRREEDRAADAYTATGSLFNTNIAGRNFLLGIDFSGFRGDTSEGYRVSLRGRKYFDAGHDLGLTVGTSTTTNEFTGTPVESRNEWVRLSGTFRLPRRFFLLTEVEITEGDDLAGERFILQLGYRL